MIFPPVFLFTVLVSSLPVLLVGTILVQLTRWAIQLVAQMRARHTIPADWWVQFEREFRAYADPALSAVRDAEKRP